MSGAIMLWYKGSNTTRSRVAATPFRALEAVLGKATVKTRELPMATILRNCGGAKLLLAGRKLKLRRHSHQFRQ